MHVRPLLPYLIDYTDLAWRRVGETNSSPVLKFHPNTSILIGNEFTYIRFVGFIQNI